MGKGGRRRENGEFSSVSYDLEALDSDSVKPGKEPAPTIRPLSVNGANRRLAMSNRLLNFVYHV